jgi:hypothetical protein
MNQIGSFSHVSIDNGVAGHHINNSLTITKNKRRAVVVLPKVPEAGGCGGTFPEAALFYIFSR